MHTQLTCHVLVLRFCSTRAHSKGGAQGGGHPDMEAWNANFSSEGVVPWDTLTPVEKVKSVAVSTIKIGLVLFALYAFICSLSFLADGFRLLAGKQAGEVFQNSELFNNPIAGCMVGVLVTVLVQSSSTSTSIIITMVAADLLTVKQALFLVMGANIGTSVTSTIVAVTQSNDKNEFRRAFAAATVHDMFNFLTVLVLLPIEVATSYLQRLSGWLISLSPGLETGDDPPDILKKLTKPFTKEVIKIDKDLIKDIAAAVTPEEKAELEGQHMLKHLFGMGPDKLSDTAAGVIILTSALAILCISLFMIVYILKGLLKGRVAVMLHRSVNGDIPDIRCGNVTFPMKWLSGYIAMTMGLLMTLAVQSSSITTSTLTPLVGIGVLTVDRMYPTVLGANIGTCITGVLAALAASASKLYLTLQVAYAHLLFNLTGIIIWYSFWPLRPFPIWLAKQLGNITAEYKWFALTYILFAFLLIPLLFMVRVPAYFEPRVKASMYPLGAREPRHPTFCTRAHTASYERRFIFSSSPPTLGITGLLVCGRCGSCDDAITLWPCRRFHRHSQRASEAPSPVAPANPPHLGLPSSLLQVSRALRSSHLRCASAELCTKYSVTPYSRLHTNSHFSTCGLEPDV